MRWLLLCLVLCFSCATTAEKRGKIVGHGTDYKIYYQASRFGAGWRQDARPWTEVQLDDGTRRRLPIHTGKVGDYIIIDVKVDCVQFLPPATAEKSL